MEKQRLVVIEISAEEEADFDQRRSEILQTRRVNRIPVSANEIDINEWEKAFSITGEYMADIMGLFYFYEDDKDTMRIN